MASRRACLALLSGFAVVAAVVAVSETERAADAPIATALVNGVADSQLPPLALEDLSYPGAALIQQQKKILLKKGDGNIVMVPCEGTTDILIKNRVSPTVEFCFDVRVKPGYLTLELPDSFGIMTDAYPVTATISANGEQKVINAAVNDYVPFGEGVGGPRSVLVELRVMS
ncbi:hypothetical protein [Streptomyces sp. TRM49041]|uniref:hypothetical protein n=1 Tax=Streptomyces sp. TRM49041 TaxID=2603216 RepID=UPI0011ED455B|nr:hypothetical protein [Streptomyces sp. TRM49041]